MKKMLGKICLILAFFMVFCSGQINQNGSIITLMNDTENDTEEMQEVPVPKDLITVKLTPHIAGVRVESPAKKEGKSEGFIKYDNNGASEVTPDTNVKFVIFGYWLDRVKDIFFTFDNCLNPIMSIHSNEFDEHNDKIIELEVKFAESESPYRICYREDGYADSPDKILTLDDYRTQIFAKPASHSYYLPLPIQIVVIGIFLLLSALFAGLNLGLMAISPHELQIILNSGSKSEREYAAIVLPVRQRGNYLLCTILLTNAFFNAAIALLIEDIINSLLSIGLATAFIVIFAEIIPQSICRIKGLAVGAYTIWITKFFLGVAFPIAYPVGKLLDFILGEETFVYNRNKLLHLMKIAPSWDKNEKLAEDLKIAIGAMEISDKKVKEVMTHIDDVFMVSDDTVLNHKNIAAIVRRGHTRLPVYTKGDRNQIVSILFLKDLALLDPDDEFTVSTVCQYYKRKMRFVSENTPLHMMLNEFKAGDYHLAFVTSDAIAEESENEHETNTIEYHKASENDSTGKVIIKEFETENDSNGSWKNKAKVLGLITLEDIVEEILQAEIIDESDMILDNKYKMRRKFSSYTNNANTIYKCDSANGNAILEFDEPCKHTSQALATTTLSWLHNRHRIFTESFCEPRALLGLIHKNMRKIDLTHSAPFNENDQEVPEPIELYKAGVPSKYFIVIIEGRATIHFPQSNMKFQVGPWESFGGEILKLIEEHISDGKFKEPVKTIMTEDAALLNSIEFEPDYDLIVTTQCKYLRITVSAYLNAYKLTGIATKFKELVTTNRENKVINTNNIDRPKINRVEYIKTRAIKSMDSEI